jgi:hypothetical protein
VIDLDLCGGGCTVPYTTQIAPATARTARGHGTEGVNFDATQA